jgi:hypothetical protein
MAWELTGNSGTNSQVNFLGTTDAQPLVIQTNNSERLRVDSDGNLGIGTALPVRRFHIEDHAVEMLFGVEGGASVLRVENSAATSLTVVDLGNNTTHWQLRVDGTDGDKFKLFDATRVATPITVDTAGRLGIGTSTPGGRLNVVDDGCALNFADEGGSAVLRVNTSVAAKLAVLDLAAPGREWQLRVDGTDGGKFKLFDVTRVATPITVDTAGKVGIGTTSPNSTLHVAGDLFLSGRIQFNDGSIQQTAQIAQTTGPRPRAVCGTLPCDNACRSGSNVLSSQATSNTAGCAATDDNGGCSMTANLVGTPSGWCCVCK